MERVSELAAQEVSVLELTDQIQQETRKELDKGQREFILRQQLREIQKQLGEENEGADIEELRAQIEAAQIARCAQSRQPRIRSSVADAHRFARPFRHTQLSGLPHFAFRGANPPMTISTCATPNRF